MAHGLVVVGAGGKGHRVIDRVAVGVLGHGNAIGQELDRHAIAQAVLVVRVVPDLLSRDVAHDQSIFVVEADDCVVGHLDIRISRIARANPLVARHVKAALPEVGLAHVASVLNGPGVGDGAGRLVDDGVAGAAERELSRGRRAVLRGVVGVDLEAMREVGLDLVLREAVEGLGDLDAVALGRVHHGEGIGRGVEGVCLRGAKDEVIDPVEDAGCGVERHLDEALVHGDRVDGFVFDEAFGGVDLLERIVARGRERQRQRAVLAGDVGAHERAVGCGEREGSAFERLGRRCAGVRLEDHERELVQDLGLARRVGERGREVIGAGHGNVACVGVARGHVDFLDHVVDGLAVCLGGHGPARGPAVVRGKAASRAHGGVDIARVVGGRDLRVDEEVHGDVLRALVAGLVHIVRIVPDLLGRNRAGVRLVVVGHGVVVVGRAGLCGVALRSAKLNDRVGNLGAVGVGRQVVPGGRHVLVEAIARGNGDRVLEGGAARVGRDGLAVGQKLKLDARARAVLVIRVNPDLGGRDGRGVGIVAVDDRAAGRRAGGRRAHGLAARVEVAYLVGALARQDLAHLIDVLGAVLGVLLVAVRNALSAVVAREGVALAVARDGNRLGRDELVAVAVERKRDRLRTHAVLVAVVAPDLGHRNLNVVLRDRVGNRAAIGRACACDRAGSVGVDGRIVAGNRCLGDPVGVGLAGAALVCGQAGEGVGVARPRGPKRKAAAVGRNRRGGPAFDLAPQGQLKLGVVVGEAAVNPNLRARDVDDAGLMRVGDREHAGLRRRYLGLIARNRVLADGVGDELAVLVGGQVRPAALEVTGRSRLRGDDDCVGRILRRRASHRLVEVEGHVSADVVEVVRVVPDLVDDDRGHLGRALVGDGSRPSAVCARVDLAHACRVANHGLFRDLVGDELALVVDGQVVPGSGAGNGIVGHCGVNRDRLIGKAQRVVGAIDRALEVEGHLAHAHAILVVAVAPSLAHGERGRKRRERVGDGERLNVAVSVEADAFGRTHARDVALSRTGFDHLINNGPAIGLDGHVGPRHGLRLVRANLDGEIDGNVAVGVDGAAQHLGGRIGRIHGHEPKRDIGALAVLVVGVRPHLGGLDRAHGTLVRIGDGKAVGGVARNVAIGHVDFLHGVGDGLAALGGGQVLERACPGVAGGIGSVRVCSRQRERLARHGHGCRAAHALVELEGNLIRADAVGVVVVGPDLGGRDARHAGHVGVGDGEAVLGVACYLARVALNRVLADGVGDGLAALIDGQVAPAHGEAVGQSLGTAHLNGSGGIRHSNALHRLVEVEGHGAAQRVLVLAVVPDLRHAHARGLGRARIGDREAVHLVAGIDRRGVGSCGLTRQRHLFDRVDNGLAALGGGQARLRSRPVAGRAQREGMDGRVVLLVPVGRLVPDVLIELDLHVLRALAVLVVRIVPGLGDAHARGPGSMGVVDVHVVGSSRGVVVKHDLMRQRIVMGPIEGRVSDYGLLDYLVDDLFAGLAVVYGQVVPRGFPAGARVGLEGLDARAHIAAVGQHLVEVEGHAAGTQAFRVLDAVLGIVPYLDDAQRVGAHAGIGDVLAVDAGFVACGHVKLSDAVVVLVAAVVDRIKDRVDEADAIRGRAVGNLGPDGPGGVARVVIPHNPQLAAEVVEEVAARVGVKGGPVAAKDPALKRDAKLVGAIHGIHVVARSSANPSLGAAHGRGQQGLVGIDGHVVAVGTAVIPDARHQIARAVVNGLNLHRVRHGRVCDVVSHEDVTLSRTGRLGLSVGHARRVHGVIGDDLLNRVAEGSARDVVVVDRKVGELDCDSAKICLVRVHEDAVRGLGGRSHLAARGGHGHVSGRDRRACANRAALRRELEREAVGIGPAAARELLHHVKRNLAAGVLREVDDVDGVDDIG